MKNKFAPSFSFFPLSTLSFQMQKSYCLLEGMWQTENITYNILNEVYWTKFNIFGDHWTKNAIVYGLLWNYMYVPSLGHWLMQFPEGIRNLKDFFGMISVKWIS